MSPKKESRRKAPVGAQSYMLIKYLYSIFGGFVFGFGSLVPGFSSSAIAIPLGIYQDLVAIVSNPVKELRLRPFFFALLGLGALLGIAAYVMAFKFLVAAYEKTAYFLFAGLIAGSLMTVFKTEKASGFKARYLAAGIGAFVATIAVVLLAPKAGASLDAKSVTSSLTTMGAIGFTTGLLTLIPGMAISTVLLVTGIYLQLMSALESLMLMDLSYVAPLGVLSLCFVVGLVVASKGIKTVLYRYPRLANASILGFMAGSVVCILIHAAAMDDGNFNWLIGTMMLGAGFGASTLFVQMKKAVDRK